jgi:hypothetical protein
MSSHVMELIFLEMRIWSWASHRGTIQIKVKFIQQILMYINQEPLTVF